MLYYIVYSIIKDLLVGYHGEPKVNLFHNFWDYIGIILLQKVRGYLLYQAEKIISSYPKP